jgi:hypothetical protein
LRVRGDLNLCLIYCFLFDTNFIMYIPVLLMVIGYRVMAKDSLDIYMNLFQLQRIINRLLGVEKIKLIVA